jgi:membrane protein implicated in regulation of membrane protease activity
MARAQGRQAVPEGSRVKITDVYGATVVVEEIR